MNMEGASMNQQELNALVGKELMIRKAKYICLAAGEDSLLLLQICTRDEKLLKNGDPVQFVVAWHPDWYCGELTWSNGSYYPLYGAGYMRTGCASALALLEAALHLTGNAAHGTEKGRLRSDPNVR